MKAARSRAEGDGDVRAMVYQAMVVVLAFESDAPGFMKFSVASVRLGSIQRVYSGASLRYSRQTEGKESRSILFHACR
jgi:hypothetical protein